MLNNSETLLIWKYVNSKTKRTEKVGDLKQKDEQRETVIAQRQRETVFYAVLNVFRKATIFALWSAMDSHWTMNMGSLVS